MTTVVAAIITRNSKLLICQRRGDKAFPMKWEFPGGKVEAGESLADALGREILEELGARIEIGREVYRAQHRYAEISAPIQLVFYFSKLAGAKDDLKLSDEQIAVELAGFNAGSAFEKVVWATPAELPEYDFLEANSPLIARIASRALPLE